MHPHILMELAQIRSETLIDEARRTALASQLRRQARRRAARQALQRPGSPLVRAAAGCLLCGRSPCTCQVAT